MGGRVPAVVDAPARDVAAASRIAGWLSELLPRHRGAFFVRYDGRRWPVRLLRKFGALTSVVVRFAVMQREWGPTETMAEIEQAVVAELLADIAATARPVDITAAGGGLAATEATRKLRSLQRARVGPYSARRRSAPTSKCAVAPPAPSRPRRRAHERITTRRGVVGRTDPGGPRAEPDGRRGAPMVLQRAGRRLRLRVELRAPPLVRRRRRRVAYARGPRAREGKAPDHPVSPEEHPRPRRGGPPVRVRAEAVAGTAQEGARAAYRHRRAPVLRTKKTLGSRAARAPTRGRRGTNAEMLHAMLRAGGRARTSASSAGRPAARSAGSSFDARARRVRLRRGAAATRRQPVRGCNENTCEKTVAVVAPRREALARGRADGAPCRSKPLYLRPLSSRGRAGRAASALSLQKLLKTLQAGIQVPFAWAGSCSSRSTELEDKAPVDLGERQARRVPPEEHLNDTWSDARRAFRSARPVSKSAAAVGLG